MPKIETRFLGREASSQVSGCMYRPKKFDVSMKTFCSNILVVQKLMFRYRHAWRNFALL